MKVIWPGPDGHLPLDKAAIKDIHRLMGCRTARALVKTKLLLGFSCLADGLAE
jgi:hypothetical protein